MFPLKTIHLYIKDPSEPKYKYLINKKEKVGTKYFSDPKAFVEYDNDINNIFEDIDQYNPEKDRRIRIALMI